MLDHVLEKFPIYRHANWMRNFFQICKVNLENGEMHLVGQIDFNTFFYGQPSLAFLIALPPTSFPRLLHLSRPFSFLFRD